MEEDLGVFVDCVTKLGYRFVDEKSEVPYFNIRVDNSDWTLVLLNQLPVSEYSFVFFCIFPASG